MKHGRTYVCDVIQLTGDFIQQTDAYVKALLLEGLYKLAQRVLLKNLLKEHFYQ